MRNPEAKNPSQQSVYVTTLDWEAARELARRRGRSISSLIVLLIRRERGRILGKDWKPEVKP
jgi:hypothetical protein